MYTLSYVWGSGANRLSIKASNATFRITNNLHHFFEQVRHPVERVELRGPYWVDAVCINQRDSHEKNSQMTMMDDMYRHAREGVLWLGAESIDIEMALNLFQETYILILDFYRDLNHQDASSYPIMNGGVQLRDLLDVIRDSRPAIRRFMLARMERDDCQIKYSQRAWRAVVSICTRPWFRRIWTVQEIALPPSSRNLRPAESRLHNPTHIL